MPIWQRYHLAQTVEDALFTLDRAPQPSCVIAGGTDLLLDLQQGRHELVHTLVDISKIPEMNELEVRRGSLFIGAAVPLKRVLSSPLVLLHAQALHEAVGLIGGPQVRNTATLGGNVAHALPAGDGTIALVALDATVEIATRAGRQRLPIGDLYLGPGKSILTKNHDLLVGFYLPLQSSQQGSAFRRIMRPQGVAIAILNMAAWVHMDGEVIINAHLSVGPAGPVPFRARETENFLISKQISEETLGHAANKLLGEARFRTSPHRASTEYRQQMAALLLHEVISCAAKRAGYSNSGTIMN